MKTDIECLPCFLRQSLRVAKIAESGLAQQLQIVRKVAQIISSLPVNLSPPENAEQIYATIALMTGCDDPYRHLKKTSNEQALQLVPVLRRELQESSQALTLAIRFAIAGNIIDYGAFATFDFLETLRKSRSTALAVDHIAQLQRRITMVGKGGKVLYLTDNCGEIVYDGLLIEYLHRQGLEIVVAVKDGPIINDALREDAIIAGLDRYSRIIANGSRCPGTVLSRCSFEFLEIFANADLVIAKGQGNFESLSEVDREIFFLLTLKCGVAARHLAELAGLDAAKLPGEGEMAVYCSTKNNNIGGLL